MKIAVAIILLVPVMVLKAGLVVAGIPIVWAKLKWADTKMRDGVYQIGVGQPFTYWEAAIRNPVGGFGWLIDHPPRDEVKTYGEVREPSHIKFVNGAKIPVPHFQWRFRHHGLMCSIRLLWIYPRRNHYGELYLGWKLNSAPPELDFAMSPRPWATVGN